LVLEALERLGDFINIRCRINNAEQPGQFQVLPQNGANMPAQLRISRLAQQFWHRYRQKIPAYPVNIDIQSNLRRRQEKPA
jgi:hypothetical protein